MIFCRQDNLKGGYLAPRTKALFEKKEKPQQAKAAEEALGNNTWKSSETRAKPGMAVESFFNTCLSRMGKIKICQSGIAVPP
jgi:hypothetical protein